MVFPTKLLRWFRANGRHLPWRHTRDPYRILVSEIMLQQTQVSRVLGFYDRWLRVFPNWTTLARAGNADVIRAWSGLGYNRRALTLRDIAKSVVSSGEPTTEAGWLALKGIGPYTAAAISAFAQQRRTLPIDTNIRRVLSRYFLGIKFPGLSVDSRLQKRTQKILPRTGKFYDVPQAVFDLAAMVCTKNPECASCPLRKDCLSADAFLSGKVRAPKRSIKKANESHHRNKPHPDRIYRGRILKFVHDHGASTIETIAPIVDAGYDEEKDKEWIEKMLGRMEKDGLVRRKGTQIQLA
ncbi:A/G-specific adenine glycosylase [Candidatus Uhrbacteria bacterium]|nr:A/G-specific adenine glycosylase [Candidatus Uhrbacteria bacterium]